MSQVASEVDALQGELGLGAAEKVVGKSPWQIFWARFRQDKAALAGLFFVIFLALVAVGAEVITDTIAHDPNDISMQLQQTNDYGNPRGPNEEFWLGADRNGRDVFARVIHGTRTSLSIAVLATGIALLIGVVLGIVAGYFGGVADTIISRTIDIILSVPLLFFAIGIAAACGSTAKGCLGGFIAPGYNLVLMIVGLFSWPYIARIVRGNTLSIREKEFIEASRATGASHTRIMFREVLPNLLAPIIVYATLLIPSNIIFEASLSFLGVGLKDSNPSWGAMLDEAADIFDSAPWLLVAPGVMLLITVLSFNLLGDGLRDALDPRQAK